MGRNQGTFTSMYARVGPRFLARPPGLRRFASPWTRPHQLGGTARAVVSTKLRLLLLLWVNLNTQKRRQLNALSALNRRVIKAYLLKESLDRLWSYRMKERCFAT